LDQRLINSRWISNFVALSIIGLGSQLATCMEIVESSIKDWESSD
jgi:hypothetical protein